MSQHSAWPLFERRSIHHRQWCWPVKQTQHAQLVQHEQRLEIAADQILCISA
jgi:hypothetical protein